MNDRLNYICAINQLIKRKISRATASCNRVAVELLAYHYINAIGPRSMLQSSLARRQLLNRVTSKVKIETEKRRNSSKTNIIAELFRAEFTLGLSELRVIFG